LFLQKIKDFKKINRYQSMRNENKLIFMHKNRQEAENNSIGQCTDIRWSLLLLCLAMPEPANAAGLPPVKSSGGFFHLALIYSITQKNSCAASWVLGACA
jgi:hypothetical protein